MTFTTTFASGIQIDSALQIRAATEPFEIIQLRAVLDAEHYLKAGRPAGHVLCRGFTNTTRKMAAKILSPSCVGRGASSR